VSDDGLPVVGARVSLVSRDRQGLITEAWVIAYSGADGHFRTGLVDCSKGSPRELLVEHEAYGVVEKACGEKMSCQIVFPSKERNSPR
jgi:hypothetical protein